MSDMLLACRDITNRAPLSNDLNQLGPGWLCHDKLKRIGHCVLTAGCS